MAEDNPGDARLTIEGFKDAKVKNKLTVVEDGKEALAYLRHEGPYANVALPEIMLLELNMPKKAGQEVLAEIKADGTLRHIPVLAFTVSGAENDILEVYDLQASAFITKHLDFDEFTAVVESLKELWLTIVKLPKGASSETNV